MKPLLIYLVVFCIFPSCSLYYLLLVVEKKNQISVPKNEVFSFHLELLLVYNYEIYYVNSSLKV